MSTERLPPGRSSAECSSVEHSVAERSSAERRRSFGRARRSGPVAPVSRSARRFARLSAAAICGLVLLAGGLAAANGAQGPRLAEAEANAAMLIERGDQRLVLHANQPVAEVSAEQVVVEPAAPFEVVSDGAAVTLRFQEPLRYGVEYAVTARVRGAYTGSEGTLRTTLQTPDPGVHTLIRAAEGEEDRVVRRGLTGGGGDETVFVADRIQEYAIAGDVIAAVTLDEAGRPALGVAPLVGGSGGGGGNGVGSGGRSGEGGGDAVALAEAAAATTRLTPEGVDSVSQLRVEPVTGLIGYVVDGGGSIGREHRGALLVDDPSTDMTTPTEIRDAEGRPLPVAEWSFVRGTTELVLETRDGGFFVAHEVRIAPGSLLAETLTEDRPVIQSAHHQAVRDLGAGLTATAWADDGLVEAFEDRDRWVIGVQWHPEGEAAAGSVRDGQFLALAAEIGRRAALPLAC